MWPFLLFGGAFAAAATLDRPYRPSMFLWVAMLVVTILFIGLRHDVGMDWNNYLRMISYAENALASRADWLAIFSVSEPLYSLLLAIGIWSGGGMYVVNLVATPILVFGVYRFALTTREPWLCLVSAMPILLIVVGMSANRQAIAIGVFLYLLSNWGKFGPVKRALVIFVAGGFHASALVLLGFVALDLKLSKPVRFVGVGIFVILAAYMLQQTGFAEYYDQAYGRGRSEVVESGGALIHVGLNAIPASFYFLLPRYRKILFSNPIIKNLAFASLLTVPFVFISSAAAGRISLYWFPVSLWVWAAVPSILAVRYRRAARLAISAAMLLVLFLWLSFANSAHRHIPYQNALLLERWELHIGVIR